MEKPRLRIFRILTGHHNRAAFLSFVAHVDYDGGDLTNTEAEAIVTAVIHAHETERLDLAITVRSAFNSRPKLAQAVVGEFGKRLLQGDLTEVVDDKPVWKDWYGEAFEIVCVNRPRPKPETKEIPAAEPTPAPKPDTEQVRSEVDPQADPETSVAVPPAP